MEQILKNLDVLQILALGAIGLGFFLAILSYRLLTQEQKIENPRPILIRAIYIFMGFALSLVVLGILGQYLEMKQNNVQPSDAAAQGSTINIEEIRKSLFTKGLIVLKTQTEACPPGSIELGKVSMIADPGARANFEKYFTIRGVYRGWKVFDPVMCVYAE